MVVPSLAGTSGAEIISRLARASMELSRRPGSG